MILPNKYIKIEESYIGLSALILDILSHKSLSLDKLWYMFNNKYINTQMNLPSLHKFFCVIDYMYLTGMINYNKKGEIYNENI